MPFDEVRKEFGLRLPRVEAHCNYKAACHFNDLFDVVMRLREVAEKTITWDFEAIRQDGKVAADGYIKCIAVDSEWKAIPLPQELAKLVQETSR